MNTISSGFNNYWDQINKVGGELGPMIIQGLILLLIVLILVKYLGRFLTVLLTKYGMPERKAAYSVTVLHILVLLVGALVVLNLVGFPGALLFRIIMVEAGADEVSESIMIEALAIGHEAIQSIITLQEEMREAVGKPKREVAIFKSDPELVAAVQARLGDRIPQLVATHTGRDERNAAMDVLREEIVEGFLAEDEMADAKAILRHLGKDLQLVQVLAKPGMAFLKRPELELGQIFNHRLDHGGYPPRSGIVQELDLSSDQCPV